MIIKELKLHNFGVYAGTNVFDFKADKPIALIGGLNGRGKTTFLEAVLLSLYGKNSFAYSEGRRQTYGQYLKSYVNVADGSKTSKVSEVATTMTNCYKLLASKKTLIDRIDMDPVSLDMIYLNKDGGKVPGKSLSAGEKQMMVIALLWSLAICSNKRLPVIIDTPLSRLDSVHRQALIKVYFPKASDQTIILSTDSEINNTYYSMMKDNIGDEFTLVYDENSKSTTIKTGYYMEEAK